MKIAAGCIALLVALILLGGALMDYSDDAKIAGVDRLFLADPFGNRLELRRG